MKYDEEYGTFKFTPKDMETVLNALSYYYRNNGSTSEHERHFIYDLHQSLNDARRLINAN